MEGYVAVLRYRGYVPFISRDRSLGGMLHLVFK